MEIQVVYRDKLFGLVEMVCTHYDGFKVIILLLILQLTVLVQTTQDCVTVITYTTGVVCLVGVKRFDAGAAATVEVAASTHK